MKGEVLVEDGAVDQKPIEAVCHECDRHAFRTAAPAAVNGTGQVSGVAAVLGVMHRAVEQGIGGFKFG